MIDPRTYMHGAERFLGADIVAVVKARIANDDSLRRDETRLLMDLAVRKRTALNELVKEARLQQKQWFDYRFYHPLEAATWCFWEFEQAYVEKYGQYIDISEAKVHRGTGGTSYTSPPARVR